MASNGVVLKGPKTPYWTCPHCTCSVNWASRLACMDCSRSANGKQRRKAEEAAAQWSAAPRPRAANGPGGRWAGGPPRGHGDMVATLRAELAAAKAVIAKGPTAALRAEMAAGLKAEEPEEEASNENIERLAKAADAMLANYGAEDPVTIKVQRDLTEARKKRDSAKPLRAQIVAAEKRVDRKQKAVEHATTKAQELKDEVLEAQNKAEEAAKAQEVAQDELHALEAELQALRLKAVQEGKKGEEADAASAPPLGAAWLASLPQAVLSDPALATELAAVQQAELAMQKIKQAAATAAAAAIPVGGLPPQPAAPAAASSADKRGVLDSGLTDNDVGMGFDDEDEQELEALINTAMADDGLLDPAADDPKDKGMDRAKAAELRRKALRDSLQALVVKKRQKKTHG
jgi:hypothetical protein